MNLSEESKAGDGDAPHSSSQGAFWAMVNLILFFVIMMIVVLIVLTDDEIAAANTNILYAIANKLFPTPWNLPSGKYHQNLGLRGGFEKICYI